MYQIHTSFGIGQIYEFSGRDPEIQKRIVDELDHMINKGNGIGWKPHRQYSILPLCKQIAGAVLTQKESELLSMIETSFENIRTPIVLDICLMFWQVTLDTKYKTIIQRHASNLSSPICEQAQMLIQNYI